MSESSPESVSLSLSLFLTPYCFNVYSIMIQQPAKEGIEGIFYINSHGKVTFPVHTGGVQTHTHTKMDQARFNKKL